MQLGHPWEGNKIGRADDLLEVAAWRSSGRLMGQGRRAAWLIPCAYYSVAVNRRIGYRQHGNYILPIQKFPFPAWITKRHDRSWAGILVQRGAAGGYLWVY